MFLNCIHLFLCFDFEHNTVPNNGFKFQFTHLKHPALSGFILQNTKGVRTVIHLYVSAEFEI